MALNHKDFTILLVEDNPDDVFLTKEILSRMNFKSLRVEWAESLQHSLNYLAHSKVDLILLDLTLPDSRGIETVVKIKAQSPQTPIIVITVLDDEALAIETLKQGAQDYLTKEQLNASFLSRSIRYSIKLAESQYHAQQLQAKENQYRLLAQNSDGIIILDSEKIVRFLNPVAESLLGPKAENIAGTVFEYPLNSEPFEITVDLEEGKKRILQVQTSEVEWDGEKLNLVSLRDFTEHYRMVKALEEARKIERHIAYHDALTNLPNRQSFYNELEHTLLQAKRIGQSLALLFVGIDRFKLINDSLGYSTGDLLLQVVARRIKACVRESKATSRLAGDEFTVILNGISTEQDAAKIAMRILNTLAQPISLNGQKLFLTASIGVGLFPKDGADIQALIKNTDAALRRAKDLGGNNYSFYQQSLDPKSGKRIELEGRLRTAIDRKEFILYYQPQIDIDTERIIGAESLLRWYQPELGLIPPSEFIPIAEETGLIVPLGEWVIQSSCAQCKTWLEEGLPPIRVTVNLSARQFHQTDLTELVAEKLRETALDSSHLGLEITESSVMHNPEYAVSILQKLKDMGILLSVDDFGTGYSSLSYLKRFPIDVLKVDRSFVQNITTDLNDAAITTAIIGMAHSLDLQAVAEGVETEEQLNFLRSLSCDAVQGFLYSRPLPAVEFSETLRKNSGYLHIKPEGR
ncbi:MAG TPA: EAL domain-containing protein [Candidatus Omnitrophota bacterium]|nr:EAL domain-containing protein [Candidatus Omnitrophota bacterium]